MHRVRKVGAVLVAVLAFVAAPVAAQEGSGPWRLQQALGLPDALQLEGDHRVRFEMLDEQFRAGREGHDHVVVLRTRLRGRLRVAPWLTLGAEFQDSRSYAEDANAPITNSVVNTFELLQAYLEFHGEGPFGGTQTLRAGRITMDVGSRRFVARNRYRNTSNAFTGLDWRWKGEQGRELRLFYTLPVRRLPLEPNRLRDNRAEFDEESFGTQFWGAFGRAGLSERDAVELYAFGLHEDDRPDRVTRERDLYTAGFRFVRAPATGAFDGQIESVLQFGNSRLRAPGEDLDHLAHFHHLEVGYRFDAAWQPRLALQFDYASGDRDAGDERNQRFDTLYGARRFDFGPTSIYGPFARSNLITPGLRLQVKPSSVVSAFASLRGFWLASDEDAWTAARVVDPSGDSGRYLGTQIEFRLRWDLLPGNVRLETGYAHLFSGSFVDDAPNSNRQGDSDYVYAQLSFAF